MKLQHLFAVLPQLAETVPPELEVTGLYSDARQVKPGGVFVAIPGSRADGHDFIPQAVANGALALVVSDRKKVPGTLSEKVPGTLVVEVADTRPVLDQLAARFYGEPARGMYCVGVTGTNGKTSITYFVEAILNAGGKRTGVIGTVNHHLLQRTWPSDMTTPDPLFLQKRLREFRDEGADALAIEISSHALDQRRADSVPFDAVVFTNLTRDHLDYHSSMEEYFRAKQRLFLDLLWATTKHPATAIINVDDPWGRRLRVADSAELWTYGRKDADFRWAITAREFTRTSFRLDTPVGAYDVELPMGGDHNVQNAVAAFAVGVAVGVAPGMIVSALKDFPGVPGRLQSVPNDRGLSVFVDYAHSPDALVNVLGSLEKIRKQTNSAAKIWTVFGCGGDRDKGKRPLMLRATLAHSDHVVVTSDNPRTEDPARILEDITAGAASDKITSIVDRREAIEFALSNAANGDVVLIAGKGHEDYQIVGTEKRPFSDAGAAADIMRGLA